VNELRLHLIRNEIKRFAQCKEKLNDKRQTISGLQAASFFIGRVALLVLR
jgi:hypothetical protein